MKEISDDIYSRMHHIELCRVLCKKDMYIVAGQLQESNVDPVDSWTFFMWLQRHGVPSKYIVKEEDIFYKNSLKDNCPKDVIVLQSFHGGIELLDYIDIWTRAVAFVVEWDLGGTEIDMWIRNLPQCRYVFLQHGVIATYNPIVQYACHNIYNDVNVFSKREKEWVEESSVDTNLCFVGGLPRFDYLHDENQESNGDLKTVFVMFTWRKTMTYDFEQFKSSKYWQGLTNLMSEKTASFLKSKNTRMVVALHHSLIAKLDSIPESESIHFVTQQEISYWIRRANAMITDFSSASFDFLFQHKPVVYWIPDSEETQSSIMDKMDSEKIISAINRQHNFFNVAHSCEEVIALLEHYINRQFVLEPQNVLKADSWFDIKENISQNVYDQIEKRITMENVNIEATWPKVSIIIPVYNAERYLHQCLDSILSQRYLRCEVILVNDGSSDSSLEICNSYAKLYKWIKVIDKQNGGVSTARNTGLREATGDYIAFVDVDDYLGDNFFAPLANAKEDIIFMQYKCFDELGSVTDGENIAPLKSTNSLKEIQEYLSLWLHQNIMRTPWGKFIRREIISDESFPIGQTVGEDSVFVFNILSKIKSIRTADNSYYMWRTHSDFFIQKYQLPVNTAIKYLVNEINAYRKIGVLSPKLESSLYFTFFILAEKSIGIFRWRWFSRPIVFNIWKEINLDYKNRHQKKFKKYRWLMPFYSVMDRGKFQLENNNTR